MYHFAYSESKGYRFPSGYRDAYNDVIHFIDNMKDYIIISIPPNMRINLNCNTINNVFNPLRDGFVVVDGDNRVCTDSFKFDFYYVGKYGIDTNPDNIEEIINCFYRYFISLIQNAYAKSFNLSKLECKFDKKGNDVKSIIYSDHFITITADMHLPSPNKEDFSPYAYIIIKFCTNSTRAYTDLDI